MRLDGIPPSDSGDWDGGLGYFRESIGTCERMALFFFFFHLECVCVVQ